MGDTIAVIIILMIGIPMTVEIVGELYHDIKEYIVKKFKMRE